MNIPVMGETLRQEAGRLWRSRFARNVAVLATGTAGAQVITIAFAPLITRIYGPEALGLLGTFLAITALAAPLAALTYPMAIVLPKDDRDALGLVTLSATLSFAVAFLSAAILWLGGDWLVATLRAESAAGFLLFIPLAMLFSAWAEIAHQWLIRKKEFDLIARTAVVVSLIANSAKTGIGWFHPLAAVLIVLGTIGNMLYAAMLYAGARRRHRLQGRKERQGRRASLTELARRHRDFPLYRAPQSFISAGSQSLPVLVLAAFGGPAAAGYYTLGAMVMGLPSNVVGKAVRDVFYPRITEAALNGENLPRHIVRATRAQLALGIVPFGLVVLFGPWLFSMVFGSDWVMAGEYARWLALFFLLNFISMPSVAAVPVLRIQRVLLVYELFSTGGKALGLVVGFYWLSSDLWAVALFSIIGVAFYLVMILLVVWRASRWRGNAKTFPVRRTSNEL